MRIRKTVFWPTITVSVIFFVSYILNPRAFDTALTWLNGICTGKFGWCFLLVSLFLVVISFAALVSPLGHVRIGGEQAKPLLSTWNWFSVVLCTTIAAGLIFWGAAEPLYHLMEPPAFLGLEPGSHASSVFALSSMYLHWTLTPYAIYAVPALVFAYAVYNQHRPHSFSSCLAPVASPLAGSRASSIIDSICVFSTVMGMVASLGQGILSVAGGISELTHTHSSVAVWTAVGVSLVVVFTLSACSGILKGVKWISNINVAFLILLLSFIFLLGPTSYILELALESAGVYVDHFFSRSLMLGAGADNTWTSYWTISTFANWAAWAPLTGMFLGKISYGHRIRSFLLINFVSASVCSGVWVSIFGGTALHMQTQGQVDLYASMQQGGSESVVYELLDALPYGGILVVLLVISVYLSFVTAADSTTIALSDLCCKDFPTSLTPSDASLKSIKIIWGIFIGLMAIILITSNGIAGIKMLSVIAGFPAILLLLLSGLSLVKLMIQYKKMEEN